MKKMNFQRRNIQRTGFIATQKTLQSIVTFRRLSIDNGNPVSVMNSGRGIVITASSIRIGDIMRVHVFLASEPTETRVVDSHIACPKLRRLREQHGSLGLLKEKIELEAEEVGFKKPFCK